MEDVQIGLMAQREVDGDIKRTLGVCRSIHGNQYPAEHATSPLFLWISH